VIAVAPTCAGSADSGTAVAQTAGDGASPIPALQLHVRCISWQIGRQFVRQHHYMHQAPPTGMVAFGVFADDGALSPLIGALLFNNPAARMEDLTTTMELRRMVILDVTERNAESRVIAYVTRWIKKHRPHIRRLIAYADPAAGHEGTIYKASGWRMVGMTSGSGGATKWETLRPDCKLIMASRKLKYEKVIR
jgi:hypothetical protein